MDAVGLLYVVRIIDLKKKEKDERLPPPSIDFPQDTKTLSRFRLQKGSFVSYPPVEA